MGKLKVADFVFCEKNTIATLFIVLPYEVYQTLVYMRRFKHIYHLVLFGEASLIISSFTIKIYRKDSFSALRSRIVKNTRI